jgi:thymidylate kinase
MAEKVSRPGHLIAVDGSRGNDVGAAADALAAELRHRGIECAISRWDASGLFGELVSGNRPAPRVSPRTLALLYAADLAFRLRWEIRTVLETGGVVIAAPYLETVVAFGHACGLSEHWLRDLLRFAPKPHLRGLARERKVDRGWKPRLDRGYAEYASALFAGTDADFKPRRARKEMIAALDADHGKKVFELTGKGIDEAVKAVTGSRPAAPTRSPSPPRSARR